jgi:ATP-binding cassette, subfamily G (WHITE), member 2, PDR
LFDKVLVIHQGRCVFFGVASRAKAYFQELGFEPSPRQTTADFICAVTDPNARIIMDGYADKAPRSAEDFERCFKNSPDGSAALAAIVSFEVEIEARHAAAGNAINSTLPGRSVYALPFYKQVMVCTLRHFQVLWGDKTTFFGKFGLAIIQSLVFGSLFYNQPATSGGVFTRGGVILYLQSCPDVNGSFSLFFNSLLALSELTSAYSARPILLKHKYFTFYRPAAYALAVLATDIPIIFLQVACFDLVTYFLTHLSRTASQFFINFLVLYVTTMAIYAYFRMLGALSASLNGATRITGLSLQVLVVYAGMQSLLWARLMEGYIIPRPTMHPWFSWVFHHSVK